MAEDLTLEQLLVFVERALNGDRLLLVQLYHELQRLAQHPSAPAEERALADVLCRVLMGGMPTDISHLPQSMQEELEGLFGRMKSA